MQLFNFFELQPDKAFIALRVEYDRPAEISIEGPKLLE